MGTTRAAAINQQFRILTVIPYMCIINRLGVLRSLFHDMAAYQRWAGCD